jgi:hypothetical protein
MLSRVRLAVLVTSAIAAVASVSASTASAAVPTFPDACAVDLNPAACERLTFIAETDDAISSELATSSTSSSGSTDTDTTTLTAWGVWFLAGLTVVALFAGKWHTTWRFWRS